MPVCELWKSITLPQQLDYATSMKQSRVEQESNIIRYITSYRDNHQRKGKTVPEKSQDWEIYFPFSAFKQNP